MLGSAFWLTLATLLGLCLGFAREWLLVASWGAGERSDAFLIALFLPEALRMSLAGGVLSAAALPLFLERQGERRLDWLAAILPALLGIAVALSFLLLAAAPWLVRLLGPGLAETASAQAAANLRVLAWCVPGLMLHALFSIPCRPPSASSWPGSARCCSTCRRCSTWPCTARPASPNNWPWPACSAAC